jgi:hypothetical protein
MTDIAPIARIQSSRWFKHALSVAQLVGLLEVRLRALECARDARAVFCFARLLQLRQTCGLLESDAFGADEAWVERLEIEHVHQYLRAADSWDRADLPLTAAPWRLIFARERQGDTEIGESLRIGTIAHLAYDLPLALARIGAASAAPSATERAYGRLTEIYAMTTADAMREVMARYDRKRAGNRQSRARLGEPTITDAWQRELREQAWDDAAALIESGEDGRHIAFTRIELATMCEIRRATSRA